jgi:chemotaxis protein CheX
MIGELVNVIAGNAVGQIQEYNLDISVPMVVQGANHRIAWPQMARVTCVGLSTPAGDCEVAVSFKGREGIAS